MDSLSPDVSPEKLIGMMQASGSGMQFVVDHISEEIEKSIGRAGLHLNAEFFAGEFPTGSFNAQACLVSNGTLLLLNTGLMVFLHKASKLVSHSIRFAPFGSDGKPILGTEERDDKPDTLSYAEQVDAFAELIVGYLFAENDWVRRVRRIPFVTGAKAMLSAMVVNSAEKFVLAHEYGHAIAGHLSTSRTMVNRTPVGNVEFVAKRWEDEFEADLIAAMLMITDLPRKIERLEELFPLQFATAGPLFFFALDRLITKVALDIKGLNEICVITDHPPSDLRMQSVREVFQRIGGSPATQLADAYVDWVNHVGNDVLTSVRERLRTQS